MQPLHIGFSDVNDSCVRDCFHNVNRAARGSAAVCLPLAANVPTDEKFGLLSVSAHFLRQPRPRFKPLERFVPTPVRNVPNSFISAAVATEKSPLFAKHRERLVNCAVFEQWAWLLMALRGLAKLPFSFRREGSALTCSKFCPTRMEIASR